MQHHLLAGARILATHLVVQAMDGEPLPVGSNTISWVTEPRYDVDDGAADVAGAIAHLARRQLDPLWPHGDRRVARRRDLALWRYGQDSLPLSEVHREQARLAAIDAQLDQVRRPDEPRDERARRPPVELLGVASCSTTPPFITAMRSLIVIASSWSWVT